MEMDIRMASVEQSIRDDVKAMGEKIAEQFSIVLSDLSKKMSAQESAIHEALENGAEVEEPWHKRYSTLVAIGFSVVAAVGTWWISQDRQSVRQEMVMSAFMEKMVEEVDELKNRAALAESFKDDQTKLNTKSALQIQRIELMVERLLEKEKIPVPAPVGDE